MGKTAMIQTRVDATLKKEAEDVLSSIGMDLTSAIRLFLSQVVNNQCIPFSLATKDVTRQYMAAEPCMPYFRANSAPYALNRPARQIDLSELVGAVTLSEEEINNDERLSYLMKKCKHEALK